MTGVICVNCGATFAESANLKEGERKPCPICGSTGPRRPQVLAGIAIKHNVTGSAAIAVSAGAASAEGISADVRSITAVADLLLQALIVPGDKTAEGRLIEAVTTPWFDIVEILKSDPNVAYQIPSDRWEEIIAGAYSKAGFEEVTLTPRSGDYGRDVIAIKKGLGSIRVIDQVKAYKPGNLVTANDVRALAGVLQGDGASKGFLTTTSDFAPRLRTDPLITPLIPSKLELINGIALLARLEELARKSEN
jgi:restriction system protein